ncbi:hypothetical protein [Sedimentibacter sp. MB31-C6]|uniref:hypothetical protein n=1 Tax=Sedimentibacter sp. MB31-C6 TaxID=3109366 RepID=UPI002DDDABCE|nr:hypothetical protein [Sedimentibacter sp. MB36-C1]WSI03244.1 hypothetical protein U8307_09325 [Sedimentibacter sp. MB36-C1]
MKKILLLFLALILVFSITACQSESADTNPDENIEENTNLEGSLESILDKIYDNANVSDSFKEYIDSGLQTVEITSEESGYFLGKDSIEFESAIASEPIMSASAYSLCLLRVKEDADIEKIKSDIKENVDPQKWVCVGVDPDKVIVDNIDDVIILIMSDDEGKALHDSFLELK